MLEKKVNAFLQRHHIELCNQGILIGVSGGPDSLALLHYLWKHKEAWNLRIAAAHVDHMFRGNESYEEALFVEAFCRSRNIQLEMKQINVPDYIKLSGKSSQAAARDCRYDFFQQVMEKYRLPVLVLGHHGDDQIETILMRLTRGSTGMARAGMLPSRPFHQGEIIRPFLGVSRKDIENYCRRFGLEPRMDPSNQKRDYTRNRFRHEVLPFLKTENPQVHEHFQRFSEDLESDERYLQELTAENMNTVIMNMDQGHLSLDIEAFRSMPMPLQRRGIRLILNYLYEEKPASLSAVHIDHIFNLISSPHSSGKLDFPNQLAIIRSYNQCHFQFGIGQKQPYRFAMRDPGMVMLPNGRKIIMEIIDKCPGVSNLNEFSIHPKDVSLPFIIRTRKHGDKMTLKGMQGSRKIKDIFIDQKIPLSERDHWPVVTDREGRILWLPGLKKSNLAASDHELTGFIQLTYTMQ